MVVKWLLGYQIGNGCTIIQFILTEDRMKRIMIMDKVWSHLVHTEFGICLKYFSDNGDWITGWNHSIMMELTFLNSNWLFTKC